MMENRQAQERQKEQKRERKKELKRAQNKAYYAAHREERKAQQRAYYAAHREERKAQQRAYNAARREKPWERQVLKQRSYDAAYAEEVRKRLGAHDAANRSEAEAGAKTRQSFPYRAHMVRFRAYAAPEAEAELEAEARATAEERVQVGDTVVRRPSTFSTEWSVYRHPSGQAVAQEMGAPITGVVVYVHPQLRFHTVRFRFTRRVMSASGAGRTEERSFCECYPGVRRNQ